MEVRRGRRLATSLGCVGVIFDAKDGAAERFYLAYGFVTILAQEWPRRMFLALGMVRGTRGLSQTSDLQMRRDASSDGVHRHRTRSMHLVKRSRAHRRGCESAARKTSAHEVPHRGVQDVVAL